MLTNLSQFFSILNDLKCYRSAFLSFTNHLGNAKPKEKPKKTLKKICFFQISKCVFPHFSSFWPLLFHQCIAFSFFIQIERFKLLCNNHLKFYKSSWNFKHNRIIYFILFERFRDRLWIVQSRIFYKNYPLTSRVITFSPIICFCLFLMQQMHQEKGSI